MLGLKISCPRKQHGPKQTRWLVFLSVNKYPVSIHSFNTCIVKIRELGIPTHPIAGHSKQPNISSKQSHYPGLQKVESLLLNEH